MSDGLGLLLMPVLVPFIAGLVALVLRREERWGKEAISLLAVAVNLVLAIRLYGSSYVASARWGGFGLDFALRIYQFSGFMLLVTAVMSVLVALYSTAFMRGKRGINLFYFYFLVTVAFTNGALLADNLVVMLFFWEGILAAVFGFIAMGGKEAFRTAIKSFIIVGVADLCLMFGIGITARLAGTLNMSQINLHATSFAASAAFILLVIGAVAKGGSMPFHSWIPDAAIDAPLPFMAIGPAALEKLLGIYFLTRITLNLYHLEQGHWLSYLLMIVGAVGLLAAVLMALVQKDYKKLLSFHAISQVGYMILGIGTAVPIGIVGGIFHMINNVIYKSCLFLTGGACERQAGSTDLSKLGGLKAKMPVTFVCFWIAAFSISGVPPFNGFFSKELVYDGALQRHWIFYLAALAGSFFTAASFLKLGHSAYHGKLSQDNQKVKEAPVSMLLPMIFLAAVCVFFGLGNAVPIRKFIQPVLGEHAGQHHMGGMPANLMLVILTVVVLAGAVANHFYGVRRTGRGLGAVDHIHYAPVARGLYDRAERRFFDPYELGMRVARAVSLAGWGIDRFVDWIYNWLVVKVALGVSKAVRACHTGAYSMYLVWALAGLGIIVVYVLR
jgi:formate hydrogenlyase subunit 3/multisubunit Na+/H+ antiporter MnhD subunit